MMHPGQDRIILLSIRCPGEHASYDLGFISLFFKCENDLMRNQNENHMRLLTVPRISMLKPPHSLSPHLLRFPPRQGVTFVGRDFLSGFI